MFYNISGGNSYKGNYFYQSIYFPDMSILKEVIISISKT